MMDSEPESPPKKVNRALKTVLIVAGVIVLIGGVGYFALKGQFISTIFGEADQGIKVLEIAITSYERRNGFIPTQEQGLSALWEKPETPPVPERWRRFLAHPMLDPWGNEYQYRIPAVKSGKRYDIYSLGPDGKESADDIGNWISP